MRAALPAIILSASLTCAQQSELPADGGPDFSAMAPDYEADVCVLGGGPSGVAAAIASARNGADTLLIEQYGFLGGASTAAGVNVFMTYRYAGGIFRDVLHRLDQLHARRGSAFDVNLMQVALDQLVAEAGVRVLLYTRGIACTVAPGDPWQGQPRRTITGLVIHNKSGIQLVRADIYLDCTGDGDLAAWAGAPFEIGRREDGLTQPMTLIFRMGGCTFKGGSLMDYPGMEDYWASYAWNPNPGEITLNMTRVRGYSGVSGEDLTAATIEGRQQVLEAVRALKQNVPGFEEAYLLEMAPQIGVRETRRVMGATVLEGEQIIDPPGMYEHRADVIARNSYPVDIHDPTGTKARIVPVKDGYHI
ncbi:MAG: FAD-dependent oxidoreductase, partial [Armatimonadota bacterium]